MAKVSVRISDEQLKSLSVEELMALDASRSVSQNRMKSLANIFIKEMIVDLGTKAYPITQKRLGELLLRKFGIELERKAIGRICHTLEQCSYFHIYCSKNGMYFDAEEAAEYKRKLMAA